MCNLVRRALENLEKVAKHPVEKVASNPVTSVAVMVFFGPEKRKRLAEKWKNVFFFPHFWAICPISG